VSDVFERIRLFNQGRNADVLRLKYRRMLTDPFAFLRGTCHLFYEDWPNSSSLNSSPSVWICGDLHLNNFGSYKGDDRLAYFDINDFDEAALACPSPKAYRRGFVPPRVEELPGS
jgi:uncharacterized protein (DUF2252 family)